MITRCFITVDRKFDIPEGRAAFKYQTTDRHDDRADISQKSTKRNLKDKR